MNSIREEIDYMYDMVQELYHTGLNDDARDYEEKYNKLIDQYFQMTRD